MDPGRERISAAELELGRLGSGQHPSSSRRQSICKAAFGDPGAELGRGEPKLG